MIYSEWQPSGGYLYYEAPGTVPINDDQVPPRLRARNKIGISSLVAGRAIPAGAEVVGEGDQPMGVIAPAARMGHLAGGEMSERMNATALYGMMGLGIITVAVIWTRG